MRFASLLAIPMAFAAVAPASALTITADSGWVDDTLLFAGGPTAGSPIEFTITQDSSFKLVDCCIVGDVYKLYQAGTLLATSTFYAGGALPGSGSYDSYWYDASYSKLDYTFTAGTYSLIVTGDGVGGVPAGLGIRLDTIQAVPEPATWAMMIGGFALVGAAMRRRKVAVAFA